VIRETKTEIRDIHNERPYVPQVASGISVGFREPGNQSGRRSDAAQ
jgi:hypothetical protein